VLASLDKTCPKCGFTITPDLVKRVDFERIECPECGEKFQLAERERTESPQGVATKVSWWGAG
jgi:ribosomal protein S27AE